MSLCVWAYGEIFVTEELPEAQEDVVAADETVKAPDRLEHNAMSEIQVLRLEGFAKKDQTARSLPPLGSRMPSVGASSAEEPL